MEPFTNAFNSLQTSKDSSSFVNFWCLSDVAIRSDETVSCTIVFKKSAGDHAVTLLSHTFHDLHIPTSLVGNRSSTKSIMIGTLFVFLQKALSCGGFSADTTLTRIVNQDQEITSTIRVATTRVPDFGEQIQNPSHGFRSLCFLGAVTVRLQDIPQALHPSHELLASDSRTDNQEAMRFAQSFQPMGVNLNSHFNVIFYPIQISSAIPTPLWRTSTPSESSLGPSDSISAIQSRTSSPQVVVTPLQSTCNPSQHSHVHVAPLCQPLQSTHNPSSFHNFPHVAPLLSSIYNSFELSSHDSAHAVTPPSNLPILFPQPQPQPLASPLSPLSLSPSPPPTIHSSVPSSEVGTQDHAVGQSLASTSRSTLVQLLLVHHAISDERREAAIFRRDYKGLYLKVQNFNAMNLILDHMGYSLPFRLTTDPTIEFSNATVRASEVLQYFGWAPTSFDHKTGWYGVAKTLSQRNWNGGVPGK
jgi:hypothetical protein